MADVDVTYETYADEEALAITTDDGVHIEISATDQETFYKLVYEIFGDAGTIAGQAYRELLEEETESGMTVKELIAAGRKAVANSN